MPPFAAKSSVFACTVVSETAKMSLRMTRIRQIEIQNQKKISGEGHSSFPREIFGRRLTLTPFASPGSATVLGMSLNNV